MIIHASKGEAEREIRALAPQIPDGSVEFLAEMYSATHLPGNVADDPVELIASVRVPVIEGSELNRLARAIDARRIVEVGLAYGFSTIWLLDAIVDHPDGRHIALDPFETQTWHGIGLRQAERFCSRPETFRWIPEASIDVLTQMARANERIDFAFIDGNHRYDNVLIDFYLLDQMLRVGGIIAFDDKWMPSIRTVASFIEANRSYKPVRHKARNMFVFEKLADDSREWDHFVPFEVHRSHRTIRRSLAFAVEYLHRKLRH